MNHAISDITQINDLNVSIPFRNSGMQKLLSIEELENSKIKTLDELKVIREERKHELIVFGCGCFDIIHADHIDYLAWARTLGDYLVVGINSDESIRHLKGNDRPIIPLENRIKSIIVNYYVDYLIIFNEYDTIHIIEALKPDIFARGKDCALDDKSQTKEKKIMNQREKREIEKYGGAIYFLDKPPIYSTTKFIEMIKNGN